MRQAITSFILSAVVLCAPLPAAWAQDEALADIRQQLTVLFVDIQRLKRELSTTGGAVSVVGGESVLERIDLIEAELGRLTALTERLENRIQRIVTDGTNRIGDLEFRLVELEGGDLSALGETTTLGGEVETDGLTAVVVPLTQTTEMAVGEQFDFDQAKAAFDAGNYQDAAVKFSVFSDTYPVGPLTGEAHYYQGEALTALGDTANAARAFLESFSGAPENPKAADALLGLGVSLGELGQINEACIALDQIPIRYPGTTAASAVPEAKSNLNCI